MPPTTSETPLDSGRRVVVTVNNENGQVEISIMPGPDEHTQCVMQVFNANEVKLRPTEKVTFADNRTEK